MEPHETISTNTETIEIALHIDSVTEALSEIKRLSFNDFRQTEFAELELHNPLIGQFIQRAFSKLHRDLGEEWAFQGLTGMLAAHHILTFCAGQPLPRRMPVDIDDAVNKAFIKIEPTVNMDIEDGSLIAKPTVIEALKLFSNPHTQRGALVIFQLFDDIIVV